MLAQPARPPLRRVVADVARQFGLDARDLAGPSRANHIVPARHAAMLVMRRGYGASLAAVGAALGGLHHTTVIYGTRAALTRCAHDAAYAAAIRTLMPEEPMADDALTLAARATVETLRRRAELLRRGGHDGLAAELELEANRLEAPLRLAEAARRRRAEEVQAARLHTTDE